jgi:branched-chain amino acid transport system permease protein
MQPRFSQEIGMLSYVTLPGLFQALINGVLSGGVFVLIAVGLALIFGVMRVINMCHGDLLMVGSYCTFWVFSWLGLNPILSLLITMPLMFLFGMVLYKFLINPIVVNEKVNTEDASLLLTFGIGIALVNFALYFFTSDYRSIRFATGSFWVGPFAFSISRVIGFLIAFFLTGFAFVFLNKNKVGKAIRATSENKDLAILCGIDERKIFLLTFGLGTAMASAAGSLVSFTFTIFPEMGLEYTVLSFIIIILGGMGSPIGAAIAAIILSVVESIGAYMFSAQVSSIFPFLALILILLIRPLGIIKE